MMKKTSLVYLIWYSRFRVYPYLEGKESFESVTEMLQLMSPKSKKNPELHRDSLLDETQISLKEQVKWQIS